MIFFAVLAPLRDDAFCFSWFSGDFQALLRVPHSFKHTFSFSLARMNYIIGSYIFTLQVRTFL